MNSDYVAAIARTYNVSPRIAREIAAESIKKAAELKAYEDKRALARELTYSQWLATENSDPGLRWDYPWIRYALIHIEALIRGDIHQLIINVCPRIGKSVLTTIRLPVYWLERNPRDRVIIGAYGSDLAVSFASQSMALYKARNPGEVDSEAQEEWTNIHGGSVKPVGVGGGVVGRGAECFPSGTRISTTVGDIDIRTLVRLQHKPLVWAFDHQAKRIVARKIIATRESGSDGLIQITTNTGRKIRATAGHRFFTADGGYKRAIDLCSSDKLIVIKNDLPFLWEKKGQGRQDLPGMLLSTKKEIDNACLLQMSKNLLPICGGLREESSPWACGCLLLEQMLAGTSCGQERSEVQLVRRTQCSSKRQRFLFGCVPEGSPGGKEAKANRYLPILPGGVCPQVGSSHLLLQDLCRPRALEEDEGQREFTLQGWNELCQAVSGDEGFDSRQGQPLLRCLQQERGTHRENLAQEGGYADEPVGSPYRRGSNQQSPRQSGNSLQDLSCDPPQVACESVSLVEQIHVSGELVYDLQVEGCHNFFAEGVLAHNCLLIDDPVKSYKEAHSRSYQNTVWDWWNNDIKTRRNLMDRTPTLICMTRWANDDLTGRILNSPTAKDWTHICLTALAEVNDPLGREPGQSILPDRFTSESLLKYREEDSSGFSSQFQQKPIQIALASFKTDRMEMIAEVPIAADRVRYWDRAATPGAGDWTVGVLMAVDSEGMVYVEDVIRGQWAEEDVERNMRQTAALDWARYGNKRNYLMQTWFEREPAASGKIVARRTSAVTLAGYDVYEDRATENKGVRARPWASCVNRGGVKLKINLEWNERFIAEHRKYVIGIDNGTDDQVDAASGAYEKAVMELVKVGVA